MTGTPVSSHKCQGELNLLAAKSCLSPCLIAAVLLVVTIPGPTVAAPIPQQDAGAKASGPEFDFEALRQRVESGDLSEAEAKRVIALSEEIKERAKEHLTLLQRIERALIEPWVFFGFAAQFIFALRFIIQLIASERKKRSYVPVAFWYLSLGGGVMLLVYAIHLRDPVFVLGQGLGCFIYIRNLILIYERRGKLGRAIAASEGAE